MSYTFQWGVAFDYLPYLLGGAFVTLHLTFLGFLAGLIIGITASVAQVYGCLLYTSPSPRD